MLDTYYSAGVDLGDWVWKVNFLSQMKAEIMNKSNFTIVILLFSYAHMD